MTNKGKCSFCHSIIGEPHSELLLADIGSDDYDDGFDYICAEVNITKYHTMVLHLTTDTGYEDADERDINFCPICGRDLRKKEEWNIKKIKIFTGGRLNVESGVNELLSNENIELIDTKMSYDHDKDYYAVMVIYCDHQAGARYRL